MKQVIIAFDVDGTLRCNCTPTCQDVNMRVMEGLYFFKSLKNVRIMIWSGGGKEYAEAFCRQHNIVLSTPSLLIPASKIDKSTWKWGQPDIAIDDQHAFNLGKINLIVREK